MSFPLPFASSHMISSVLIVGLCLEGRFKNYADFPFYFNLSLNDLNELLTFLFQNCFQICYLLGLFIFQLKCSRLHAAACHFTKLELSDHVSKLMFYKKDKHVIVIAIQRIILNVIFDFQKC